MMTLSRKPITKEQAQARTNEHKRDLRALKKGWAHLGREVNKSIEMGVPAALNMTMRAWIEDTFPGSSASHIFRLRAEFEALKHVPVEQLEKMPEGNANQFATRLPERSRSNPEIIQKAITLKPSEFKAVVEQERIKAGIVPDKWATYARRVPLDVEALLCQAEQKLARVMQIDISEHLKLEDMKKWTGNSVKVMEGFAILVNDTDEMALQAMLTGGNPQTPAPNQQEVHA